MVSERPDRLELGVRIGRRLRTLRNRAGLSTHELAAQMGMTANNLYRIERGKDGAPTVYTLVRFARALGVKPSLIAEALDR